MAKSLTKFLVPAIAVFIAGMSAAPYYLGIKTEESLVEQQKLLKESGFLTVESHTYERGWFNATETTVIRLKPTLLQNTEKFLPDDLKTVLQEPVTIVNHIEYGPFAGGFTPARAHIETEFKYHPETTKVLARFFGSQTPLSMTNTVYLSGNGEMDVKAPAFDYRELPGIKFNWKGLSGKTGYQAGFQGYTHDYIAPSLQVKLADKGSVGLENLHLQAKTSDGQNKLSLGKNSVALGKFPLGWKEGIDCNVELSELIDLVTDLQVGAFISPTGTIAPSTIEVGKLRFDTQTTKPGKFINSEGRSQFGMLTYGNDKYGPLDINVAAEHLDAQDLLALKAKLAEVADKKTDDEQIQNELIQTTKAKVSSLLTQNPVLSVKAFRFTMPQDLVDVSGKLAFKGLAARDMDNLDDTLKKTNADFNLQVSQKLIEDLAVNQARSIFNVNSEDEAAGRASIDDINEALRLMVDSTIRSTAAEEYLTVKGGNLKMHITLQNSALKLNGKVFEDEPESDFDEGDMMSGAAH